METITCTHCRGMFQIHLSFGSSGRGSRGCQHSGLKGCNKITQVEVLNGKIIRTWKS